MCNFNNNNGLQQFEEIYDLANDPHEVRNIVGEVLPAIKYWYEISLLRLLTCRGRADCDQPLQDYALQ